MAQARLTTALAAALLLAACEQGAPPATRSACSMAHAAFSQAIDEAVYARQEGNYSEAEALRDIASMNLDILMAKDCCRFDEFCVGLVYP